MDRKLFAVGETHQRRQFLWYYFRQSKHNPVDTPPAINGLFCLGGVHYWSHDATVVHCLAIQKNSIEGGGWCICSDFLSFVADWSVNYHEAMPSVSPTQTSGGPSLTILLGPHRGWWWAQLTRDKIRKHGLFHLSIIFSLLNQEYRNEKSPNRSCGRCFTLIATCRIIAHKAGTRKGKSGEKNVSVGM